MRDIRKTIKLYKEKWGSQDNGGHFYPWDITEIKKITLEDGGDMIDAIYNALAVGFVIGYRKAQRDAKKKEDALRDPDKDLPRWIRRKQREKEREERYFDEQEHKYGTTL